MALYKNVASQKVAVYAHDTAADAPKTGDAANITAQVSKDGGATAASNDTNPTELDATDAPGIYLFDLTQTESNCDLFILFAKSSTADIQLDAVVIYTLPGTNAGVTPAEQTVRDAMKLAPSGGAAAGGSIDDLLVTVETNTQNIETDTQDIQTRLPAALVSGRMDSNVQAMANGVITAAVIATGAIDADALAADAVDEILDEVIEGSTTMRQALRIFMAALANKVSGGGTTTITFRDLADSKARITATVDASGNRTAVTLDGS